MLQDVDVAHTVSVFVRFEFNTVVGGFIHLAFTLGRRVVVVRSQQEQSLLYVVVWAALVIVQRHGSRVVMIFVQATKPSPTGSGVGSLEFMVVEEVLQLVTVVVPGLIGAGVGQIIIH